MILYVIDIIIYRQSDPDTTVGKSLRFFRRFFSGWSMRFATNKANKTPYSYYSCSFYGQFGKGYCSMHYIRYDVLYQAVLERLQYWAKAVQQDEEKVLHKIQKVGNAKRIREKKKRANALKKAENRQNEIDRLFAKMYEDRACE